MNNSNGMDISPAKPAGRQAAELADQMEADHWGLGGLLGRHHEGVEGSARRGAQDGAAQIWRTVGDYRWEGSQTAQHGAEAGKRESRTAGARERLRDRNVRGEKRGRGSS